jgi:hypothetical protein
MCADKCVIIPRTTAAATQFVEDAFTKHSKPGSSCLAQAHYTAVE